MYLERDFDCGDVLELSYFFFLHKPTWCDLPLVPFSFFSLFLYFEQSRGEMMRNDVKQNT